jgi:diguanylate cyclase (GGDEF)-like protein
MADADHVTGLASRAALEAVFVDRRGAADRLSVLLCDVVGLKSVNEKEGFLAGDAVLRMAADRLRAATPGATVQARLGGDELIAVFVGDEAAEQAARAAAVLAACRSPAMRSAAGAAAPNEPAGPLIERVYAAMRHS